jgi:hypothetical protein
MDENLELLEYIYQNSEMGVFSTTKLIQDINDKENKIKKVTEGIIKGYENFMHESEKLIKKNNFEIKKNSFKTKMISSMGIKKEVNVDNSDAAIAHLLIEGLTMGVVDISSKIKNYKGDADKKIVSLAESYLKFQEESIELLKKYL